MSSPNQPRVLLVTSVGASRGAVVPVLAALQAAELEVRAIDVGRAGARSDGAFDWVVRTLAGEVAERRLMHEMNTHPPDVTVAFDPGTATAMSLARDTAARPAPVVAVVSELAPGSEWATADADRYLAVDDEAAVALADHGVESERILVIGPVCERAFVDAANQDRASVRTRFRIAGSEPVVVVQVEGLGHDITSQVALQLSLLPVRATYLFDAGDDVEAATALRRQVPTLSLRAKLFGKTEDAPLLWRCADLIVARPSDISVSRALVLGALMVSFLPEDREGESLAKAMESRALGTTAGNALLLSSAIEPLLRARRKSDDLIGSDGAASTADVAWIVASERRDVLEERRRAEHASTRARVQAAADAAEAAVRVTSAAGGLEDLGGDDAPAGAPADVPDAGEIARLRAEVSTRLGQVGKTVAEARETAERWDRRRDEARAQGDQSLEREAERGGDAERARMHTALAEMAQLQSELERLQKAAAAAPPPPPRAHNPGAGGRAPAGAGGRAGAGAAGPASTFDDSGGIGFSGRSLDDMLDDMKRKSEAKQTTIDSELAALKRKMRNKKKQ